MMVDPEISAMTVIATAMTDLDEDAQGRVLRWAAERYGVSFHSARGRRASPGTSHEEDLAENISDEEITAETPKFEYLAELFSRAQPKTDPDKALVAAYWLQVVQGNDKWQAAQLQKELKNLGHGLANVTDSLTKNMRKKPQRIIQIQKAGSAKQAWKTYRVTHEGLVYVQGMLGAGGK
jgi:hypothetical protein